MLKRRASSDMNAQSSLIVFARTRSEWNDNRLRVEPYTTLPSNRSVNIRLSVESVRSAKPREGGLGRLPLDPAQSGSQLRSRTPFAAGSRALFSEREFSHAAGEFKRDWQWTAQRAKVGQKFSGPWSHHSKKKALLPGPFQ